jgi:hypothetical protein
MYMVGNGAFLRVLRVPFTLAETVTAEFFILHDDRVTNNEGDS